MSRKEERVRGETKKEGSQRLRRFFPKGEGLFIRRDSLSVDLLGNLLALRAIIDDAKVLYLADICNIVHFLHFLKVLSRSNSSLSFFALCKKKSG